MLNAAEQRHARILELLGEKGFLDVQTLSAEAGVSGATMRRDLAELDEAGRLRRTHGGAVSVTQVSQDPAYAVRAVSLQLEKATIAAAAIKMVEDGDTVFLDAGTTALEVAKLLAARKGLTFISNGADIIAELIRAEADSVYAVGGEYAPINRAFRGPLSERFIRQFSVDKLILNAASIDLDRGLVFTGSPLNASVQQAMIEVSRRVIVVADHSKFTKSSFAVTTSLEKVGVIITDTGAKGLVKALPEALRRKFVIAH